MIQPPLILSEKICGTTIFLKHRSVSPRTFSVFWDKKLSTEIGEIPLLSVGFFESRFFLRQRKVAIRNYSGLWDTDVDKKFWYTPSSLIQKNFRCPKFSETKEGYPTKCFGTVRRRLWQKIVMHPPLLVSKKFSDTRSFLKERRVSLRNFSVLSDNDFDKKSWYTPLSLIHKIFRYQKISETQKRCPTKFFGTVRQKFGKKIVTNPYFSHQKKFAKPERFWNPEMFPHEIFWHCGTKKYQQVIVQCPYYP